MRVLAMAVLVSALWLGGCSGEQSNEDPQAPTSSPEAPASTVPESDDPATSPTPTQGASSTVEPATGDQVVMGALSLRIPAKYVVIDQDDESFIGRGQGVRGSLSSMGALRIDSLGQSLDIDSVIAEYRQRKQFLRDPKEREPVVVDGVTMFHLAGMSTDSEWVEAYGVQTAKNVYSIDFEFVAQFSPPQQRRKIIESVLATVEINE